MRKIFIVLGLVTFLIWFFFPLLFKIWVFNILVKPPFTTANYSELGPIGDIFGGLTAVFTSATLIIVIYSAYLQRQANKDAREAMAEQLKQAKEASAEQLKQAKESTKQQLDLAEITRDAQIKESQNAIFATKFYSLLNFKKDKLNSFTLQRIIIDKTYGPKEIQENPMEAIDVISLGFYQISKRDNKRFLNLTDIQLQSEFQQIARENGYKSVSILIAYFYLYTSLCELIANSEISHNDKEFYKNVLSNSMSQGEQILLFWLVPMFLSINISGSEIFTMFGYSDAFEPFALKFHKKDHFRNDEWKNIFLDNKTPA